MPYNYLDLVNSVCAKVNEVPLNTSNFASADGVYSDIKEGVNASIREINTQDYEWPFNYSAASETLVAGTNRYVYPSDTKTVDLDSFRVRFDSSLNAQGHKLRLISYSEYIANYSQDEYNTSTSIRYLPRFVFRLPSLGFGVYPIPDKAYTVDFDYFRLPLDLVNPADVPTIPEQFKHLIADGASRAAYLFRGDVEGHDRKQLAFTKGIEEMRRIYIDKIVNVRDTRIPNRTTNGFKRL